MEKILVSACLLGCKCRYDGESKINNDVIKLMERFLLIPLCPEILGGLPTPRPPAEIINEKVINKLGEDVTANYIQGAKETLYLAKLYGIKKAILKSNSPSCGCGMIYDGTFSNKLKPGDGITTKLLKENNIQVITENEILNLICL